MGLAGFLLLRDKQFSFQKDVISFVDRVVEGELYDKIRGKDMKARDLNDLLQLVRSSTMELIEWKKTLDPDKIPTAFVMAGFDELRGGASHYWNEKHQRNIVVELEGMGFDVVFVAPVISKGLNLAQSSWVQKYLNRCADFSSCETIRFEAQRREVQGREIEALSRKLSGFLEEKIKGEGKVRKLFIARETPTRRVLPQRNRIKVEQIDPAAIDPQAVASVLPPKPKAPTIFEKKKRVVRKKKKVEKAKTATPEALGPKSIKEEKPAPEPIKAAPKTKEKAKPRRRGRKAALTKIDYNASVIASY